MNRVSGSLNKQGEASVCRICGSYLDRGEGFKCPRCRRSPLCRNHRFPGRRECTGCVMEIKSKELRDLEGQERSIRGFLRLTQFLFLVFAIFFVSSRIGLTEMVSFLKDNIVVQNVGYLGGLAVAGYVLFHIILYNQKSRIRKLEADINKIKKMDIRRLT